MASNDPDDEEPSAASVPTHSGGADVLLTLDDAAVELNVSVSHLRREVRLRRLAVCRFGRLIRVAPHDLAAYVAARRRAAR